jgi:hypothetical protein
MPIYLQLCGCTDVVGKFIFTVTMKIHIIITILLLTGFTFQKPDLKIGRYSTIHKHKTLIIQVNEDSTFVFHKGSYFYSFGKWKFDNNYLICYSPELTADDSIRIALSGGTYIKIERMRFAINENAIVDIDTKIRYKFEK